MIEDVKDYVLQLRKAVYEFGQSDHIEDHKTMMTAQKAIIDAFKSAQEEIAKLREALQQRHHHLDSDDCVICSNCSAIYWEPVTECDCQINVVPVWIKAKVVLE